MERLQREENLSHLVHIEALLGKLSAAGETRPRAQRPAPIATKSAELTSSEQAAVKWPMGVLCAESLRGRVAPQNAVQRVSQPIGEQAPLSELFASVQASTTSLNAIFEQLVKDIMASRDRLLLLNPGRRKLIEHRLEYIARKIARARGERLSRSLSLTEIIKESYRDASGTQSNANTKVLGALAWRAFVSEVALYNMLELFFLKCLDTYGWRKFDNSDLGRLNFAANTFLSQRAAGFAHDKHAWNFARTNLYSWYVPSRTAIAEIAGRLNGFALSWNDRDLMTWMSNLPEQLRLPHLDVTEDARLADLVIDLLESQLGVSIVSNFQGQSVCKKFFIPTLENGGVGLAVLERILSRAQVTGADVMNDPTLQLNRALWSCESESFEAFWTEVSALLKLLRTVRGSTDWSAMDEMSRLPQVVRVIQLLGLELHNMEQLPLGGPDVSRLHQGSAGQVQQAESFDVAIVTDHLDRTKSARWMKALAEQLPYWRALVSTGTNLNWGELHLHLAVSKLKEYGYCVYLSHRVLPEGGDGEKLRKTLLSGATLEAFVELPEERCQPYRYLYVFRKVSNKLERDQYRPRFGSLKTSDSQLNLNQLEEASSTQVEIAERGWDHLFVRGAAPLIRHLNHKFPKLFQVATLQTWNGAQATQAPQGFFAGMATKALEVGYKNPTDPTAGLSFTPVCSPEKDKFLLFPHNPVDLPWLERLMSSAPAQFWIRHQVLIANKQPRLPDIRSCPVVDMSHAPAELVHDALAWLGEAKPSAQDLVQWACAVDATLPEKQAKFVAMSKRYASLQRIVARYQPLFANGSFESIKPEAITQFYPAALLCHLPQSPDIRIQYAGRERCALLPGNWSILDCHSVLQTVANRPMAYVVVHTRQGPAIQILAPAAVREYLTAQIKQLRDHTWGEALTLLRVPRDVSLFSAQTSEITRVVHDTAQQMSVQSRALDELALLLFEVPEDARQFLPH